MKLVGSNVWLALSIRNHPHQAAADAWFEGQRANSAAFCRLTQLALLRLVTTRVVMAEYGTRPLTNVEAWNHLDGLVADTRVTFEAEPKGLLEHWREFSSRGTASPKLWMDSYLAAFAVAGKHQLVTVDSAFRQFNGLDLELIG